MASNVKSQAHSSLPDVSDVFVFPHMGDGGLALGAAFLPPAKRGRVDLGSRISGGDRSIRAEIACCSNREGVSYSPCAHIERVVADPFIAVRVVCGFRTLEYGPRALGHRGVLRARSLRCASAELVLKTARVYQPFCPSILESDARMVLADWKGTPNRHMTWRTWCGSRIAPRSPG